MSNKKSHLHIGKVDPPKTASDKFSYATAGAALGTGVGVGLGTIIGATIGTVSAGPVGAVIGAVAGFAGGGIFANHYEDEDDE